MTEKLYDILYHCNVDVEDIPERADQFLDEIEKEYIDCAKMWLLIGLQAEELSRTVGKPVDLERAWKIMNTQDRIQFLEKHKDIFLGSIFEEETNPNPETKK